MACGVTGQASPHRAPFQGRTLLECPLELQAGANTVEVWIEEAPDGVVLPNGDQRPLMARFLGARFVE